MLEKIRQTVENKKVLVLGLGREGRSSLRMIRKAGGYKELAVADQNPVGGEGIRRREDSGHIGNALYGQGSSLIPMILSLRLRYCSAGKIENYKCQFVSQTGHFYQ